MLPWLHLMWKITDNFGANSIFFVSLTVNSFKIIFLYMFKCLPNLSVLKLG